MIPALLVLGAYVVGATPTSYWLAKGVHGVDLRTVGSGNLGATNTYRLFGARAAVPVMVVDVAKGWLPVWLFSAFDGSPDIRWGLAYAAAAVIGHVFSFWVGFKGGKGIATSAGAFLALAPWAVLLAFVAWLVVLLASRIMSLASLAAAVALPAGVYLLPHRGGTTLLVFTISVSLFAFWTHRSNIRRLSEGRERRLWGANSLRDSVPDPDTSEESA